MKAACIVPPSFLDLVRDHQYHMALAHIAVVDNDYSAFFRKQDRPQSTAKVILDNSVHELKESVSASMLKDAIERIRPNYVVVPDAIWEPARNLRLARAFSEEVDELQQLDWKLEFVGVPHGQDPEEHYRNMVGLCKLPYISVLGLNKATRRQGVRASLAKTAITELGRQVHSLGLWADPIAEVLELKEVEAEFPGTILGFDSSYPFRLGLLMRTLFEPRPTPPAPNFSLERRDLTREHISWIKRQLEAFRYLVEGPVSSEEELRQEYKNGRF